MTYNPQLITVLQEGMFRVRTSVDLLIVVALAVALAPALNMLSWTHFEQSGPSLFHQPHVKLSLIKGS